MIIVAILYLLCALFLALYGFNTFVLIYLYLRHRDETQPLPPLDEWPANNGANAPFGTTSTSLFSKMSTYTTSSAN